MCSVQGPTTRLPRTRCCGSPPPVGGTISAEHGVGVAKVRWLGLSRTEEIRSTRAIKHALEPRGLLNPGAVLATRSCR
jgi:FAD linked oxidases, C-terminal domain